MSAPTVPSTIVETAWSPAFGWPLVLMLVAMVLGLSAWGALRRGRGWGMLGLRCVAAGALGVVLLGPVRLERAPDESTRPGVIYLVDTSASMALNDHPWDDGVCARVDALRKSWLEANTLQRVRDAAELQLMTFDERAAATGFAALQTRAISGEHTRLAECAGGVLTRLGSGESSGAGGAGGAVSDVVLLTDGIDTDGAPLGSLVGPALAAGVRVHGVVVGRDQQPSDVSLQASIESALVYDGQPTNLKLRVRQSGFDSRPARVMVREVVGSAGAAPAGEAGAEPAGRVVFSETILLTRTNELVVPITPTRDVSKGEGSGVSLVEYVATVEPLAGEAERENNTRRTFVQVTGERIRVCVFENEPYWDSRFFIAAMREDPQVELTTVIGLGAVRQGVKTEPRMIVTKYIPGAVGSEERREPVAPLRDEDLAKFDVIALGKGVEAFFPGDEARRLVNFVTQRGGSLIFLRGKPVSAGDSRAVEASRVLDEISPVEWGAVVMRGMKLARTDEGRREPSLNFESVGPSDAVLTELPGMLASTSIEREKALSVVWLRQVAAEAPSAGGAGASDPAAVAHMSAGQGRTLAVLTDGMWRWAFLPPLQQDFGGVYRMFWARAVRWMALGGDFLPGQSVSLAVDKVKATPGETIAISVSTRETPSAEFVPSARVIAPDGTAAELTLGRSGAESGRFSAAYTARAEGVYTVELLAPGMTPDRLLTRFAVYDDRVELRDTAARPDEMRGLCEATGGRLFGLDESDALIELLNKEAESRRSVVKPVPAWDRSWVFWMIVSLLAVEWFWRRRVGLP